MTEEKRKLIEASFNNSATLQFYKAKLIEVKTDYVEIYVPKQENMTRSAGMFTGAIMSALVDASAGFAAVTHYEDDAYVVTVDLTVKFLSPAIGDALLSKAYVVKGGKKISTVRVEVFAISEDGGRPIHAATSLVTMMRIR